MKIHIFIFLTLILLSQLIFAQQFQATEDNILTFCDTNITPLGLAADTIFPCSTPSRGTATMNGTCINYTPNANHFGYDSLCITYCNGPICLDTVCQITINPIGETIEVSTNEDANFFVCENIISGGSDVIISGCSPPLYGTANFNPSCVVYMPSNNFIGADSMCIISCIDTLCDTSNLVVNINSITETLIQAVPGNGSFVLCSNDLNTVVDSITQFSVTNQPTNGVVTINSTTKCIEYTPNANFVGTGQTDTDNFTITTCNSEGICGTDVINVTITGFTITPTNLGNMLSDELEGNGVDINFVSYNCGNNGGGTFSNARTALGISDGVLLTTGNAISVAKNSTFDMDDLGNNAGDPDLNITINLAAPSTSGTLITTDVCILEMDVFVLGDSLNFNYIFGSKEYPDFVCSNFNDVFGFYVSGPNPLGGNYARENIATIPNSSIPVGINTVNGGVPGFSGTNDPNCNFNNTNFFNGTPIPGVVFNGYTTKLQAKLATVPCNTYRIKIAIGDGSTSGLNDQSLDSGVFLESGSFNSLPVSIASSTALGNGFLDAVENCVDGLFVFGLDNPLTVDYTVQIQAGGTATNGVDYSSIPDSIIIPAGSTNFNLSISPISDGISELTEEVKIYLLNNCTGLPYDSASINIIDSIPFNLNVSDNTICPGDTTFLHATITGDNNNLASYTWTPTATILNSNSGHTGATPLDTSEYFVEYTFGACTKLDSITVSVNEFNTAIDTTPISCPGANDGELAVIPNNAFGNVTYNWHSVNSIDSFITNLSADTFIVSTVDESGLHCGTIIDTLILQDPAGLTFFVDSNDVSCFGTNDGSFLISNLQDTSSYDITITYEGIQQATQNLTSSANGEILLDNLLPGIYDSILILDNTLGCNGVFSATLSEPAPLTLSIVVPGNILCAGGTIDSLRAEATGGNGDNTYLWSTNETTQTIQNIVFGTYWVETQDTNNCSASDTIIISQPVPLHLETSAIDVLCNGDSTGNAFVDSVSGGAGNYTFQWTGINNGIIINNDSALNIPAGNYYLVVTDANGCTINDTLTINEPNLIQITALSNQLLCNSDNTGEINLTITGGVPPYVHSWTGPNGFNATTEDITNLSAGIYIYQGADDHGCTFTDTVNITEPTALVLNVSHENLSCKDLEDGSATVVVTGGTPNYNFNWNGGATPNMATTTNLDTGIYQVIVTDANGCTDSISTNPITEPDSLRLLTGNITHVSCFGGNNGAAQITTQGGTPNYNYTWTNGGGNNEDLNNQSAGTYVLTVTDVNACQDQETVNITEPAQVILSETHINILCNGETNGRIDLSIQNGIPPFNHSWTGPNGFNATTEDITNLSAGTYIYQGADDHGCTFTDTVNITEPTALVLNVSHENLSCKDLEDGSATVVVTGGTPNYNFNWNGGATPNMATTTNLDTGIYQVIVTDANGCTDSISTNPITEPDSLRLLTGNITHVSCFGGNNGAAQITTQGGTPNYNYTWTNGGGNNEDLNNQSAGTYVLTVTDVNACQDQETVNITEPTAITINLAALNVDCFGANTGSVDAAVSGGTVAADYTFAWTGPNGFNATTEDIANLAAANYTLTVTDDNNCSLTQNVNITEPIAVETQFNTTPVSCFGGSNGTLTVNITAGGTAPFTYLWDSAANSQTTSTATGLSEGNFEVEITDNNGCVYNFTSTVTQPNEPLSIVLDSMDITCAGYNNGQVSVSAQGGTPGYSYLWNDPKNQTTSTATNLAPNSYQVTVTDANNCTQTGNISISEPPEIGIDSIVVDSANCWGDATGSITVYANGGTGLGYIYSINGGNDFQNNPNFYNLNAGNYNDIIIQDLGSNDDCSSPPFSTTIFEPSYFVVSVHPEDTTLQLEESVTLQLVVDTPYTVNDVAQISWSPNDGLNCTDCLDPTVLTYEYYTEYNAIISYYGDDKELCNTSTATVIIVENNLQLFIPNAFTPDGFDQTNKVFEVYGQGIEQLKMQIFNRWGEKIFESDNQKYGWDGTYQGTLQNPGPYTYYISVEYLDGKKIQKKGSVSLIR